MTAVKLSDQRGTGGGRVERRCTISTIKDEALGSTGQNAFIAVGFPPAEQHVFIPRKRQHPPSMSRDI